MQDEMRGTFAAPVTPLKHDGQVDLEAIPHLVGWLADRGVDGVLALGTTGEGVLLNPKERRVVAEAFITASRSRLHVIVHCGAQSTQSTVGLAEHALSSGAGGVAVIAPPYYPFDDQSLVSHFVAAAHACDPLPFYIYEFAARSGYPVPLSVIREVRDTAPNLVGLKVSDSPWEKVEPYMRLGLKSFIGTESFLKQALPLDAVGAVSGIAAALPEAVVAAVANPTEEWMNRLERIRHLLGQFPFQAALKYLLTLRQVPITDELRAPLRRLDISERKAFDLVLPELLDQAGIKEPMPQL